MTDVSGCLDLMEHLLFAGVCKGRFNTIFDWVRKKPDSTFIYNTYIFRKNHYWMYENHANRTRYGDPLYVAQEWKGVPNYVDGYAHVWYYAGKLITDAAYFFKGEKERGITRHYTQL